MGLSRAFLKGMGLEDEKVTAIIEEHMAVVNAIKEERDAYKTNADKLSAVQEELDKLKKNGGDWEKKYTDEHAAFDAYKKDIETKQALENVKSAYKKLLSDSKVGEKHIDSILRVTDFSAMKLDKDGKLEGADKLTETIKNDWSGFITNTDTKGANVDTPPAGNNEGGTKTGRAKELAKARYAQLYGGNNNQNEGVK